LSEKALAVGVGTGNKIVALFKIYKTAKKLLKKEKLVLENHQGYDIITVQDQYYLALIGFLLSKKFKLGLEIQVHGFEKYCGLRKLIAKFVIPKANAVRTVSQRLKRRLISEFGVEEEKITAVPIYTRIKNYELRIKNQKNDGKFIFLTVGRLVEVKNIAMQIKALANAVGTQNFVSANKKIELWIVGEGKEKEKLKDLCYALRVMRYTKFLGWQDDLEKFYRQADVFLLTSNYEGWGMAVIEAASFGLPIIMTDAGCAGEVIKGFEHATTNGVHANDYNNVSGIVIPAGDQKKLENAMLKLIEDNELRKRLGENARQAVLKLPSKENILGLYKKSWEMAKAVENL
ncbi:MAG: glycosyltransferase family 4 protein, partial [Patescibacteria group bacterium]|nr:glycosyltransferase family 4 protein [Patescibacteria group bacterium]